MLRSILIWSPCLKRTMKDFKHCNQRAANLLRLAAKLMSSEEVDGPRVSLEQVKIESGNVGASMHIHQGSPASLSEPTEQLDPHSINFYISNNIHGVSSSIPLGSEVRMADPGLYLSVGDISWEREARGRSETGLEMGGIRRFSSMFWVNYVPVIVCGFVILPSILFAEFRPVNSSEGR